MPGFWKRPTCRTYSYNLDLGEHYYDPMRSYLEVERGGRGETPGALTYSERLARRWLHGKRYATADRYNRAASVGPADQVGVSSLSYLDSELTARAAMSRARSEVRENREATPPFNPNDPNNVSAFGKFKRALEHSSRELRDSSVARQTSVASRKSTQVAQEQATASVSRSQEARKAALSRMHTAREEARSSIRQQQQLQQQQQQRQVVQQQQQVVQQRQVQQVQEESRAQMVRQESSRRIQDDIAKRVADVHMMPWAAGQELDEANSASARARARISELERELDVITKKALSSQTAAMKTAAQLAKEAMMEDEKMATSMKKTKRILVESTQKLGGKWTDEIEK